MIKLIKNYLLLFFLLILFNCQDSVTPRTIRVYGRILDKLKNPIVDINNYQLTIGYIKGFKQKSVSEVNTTVKSDGSYSLLFYTDKVSEYTLLVYYVSTKEKFYSSLGCQGCSSCPSADTLSDVCYINGTMSEQKMDLIMQASP